MAQTSGAETRAQVAGALSMVSGMKASIAEAFAQSGRFPDKYSDAGMSGPIQISYADAKLGAEGVITLTFNSKAAESLRGRIIKLVPMADASESIMFYCLAPALPEPIRPSSCH
ncbi:MAG: pilin [Pseudomonadota bacterium]